MKYRSQMYRATVPTLSDRYPRMTRGLALVFFLAGIILCCSML
jgi:hypothetical protein